MIIVVEYQNESGIVPSASHLNNLNYFFFKFWITDSWSFVGDAMRLSIDAILPLAVNTRRVTSAA